MSELVSKKKKVDYAALASPFMRIPKMKVGAARALLDLGLREIYELRGRDPHSLAEDIENAGKTVDADLARLLKIAVDFSEREQ